ncbi:MAG: GAF domain-containing protein, partial [Treponema sp.]|nr:GAF domain-containing protein [Treponema sp.]
MENSFQMSSYISIPLTIITVIACVHLLFIIAIKVRNTAKTSFILFASLAIFTIGTFYSIHSKNIITFIITILIAQLSLLPYLFILATGFKKSKLDDAKNFEQGSLDTSSSKKIEHLISISQELSEAASHSIARDTDVNEFLDFICNKLMEATESSGAIILSADEYENTLSVKSLLGNFPPVQKLPENIPLEKGAVQSYLKSSSFPFHGNIFGEASFAPSPILITNGAKDKRIYQNGEEDFLSCGSFIFFPIKLPNSASAVAVLSRTTSEPQFTNDDLQNARLVVNSLSTIIMPLASAIEFTTHQQLNKEGDTASKFHNELLQKKFPKFNTLSFGC